jgi:hypothetical protein
VRSYNINPDASGSGAESDFINRILKRLEEMQPYDSQTVTVEQTTRGTRWHAKIPPPAAGKAGTMNFVGEYDPTRTYSLLQICIISSGSNAGTFVYINATPSSGNAPYAGGGFWVQLPMGQLGAWM